jgi:hypothetical protein
MAEGPFVKVYQSIVDDPMFAEVFDKPVLAQWLRMLLLADAMYPASAPMPRRTPDVRLLIASGLVEEKPGNRYSMRGLTKEREHRSAVGRNAAAVRWQSERNAMPMPNRAEQSRAEQGNGQSPRTPAGFLGYPKKDTPREPGGPVVPIHDGRHGTTCLVCFPVTA